MDLTDYARAEVIIRPNGKPYRSRKIIAYIAGEEDDAVIVLGTHDIARAQILADEIARQDLGTGFTAVSPRLGWWRDGFENGQRRWVSDEANGRAGIFFAEIVEVSFSG